MARDAERSSPSQVARGWLGLSPPRAEHQRELQGVVVVPHQPAQVETEQEVVAALELEVADLPEAAAAHVRSAALASQVGVGHVEVALEARDHAAEAEVWARGAVRVEEGTPESQVHLVELGMQVARAAGVLGAERPAGLVAPAGGRLERGELETISRAAVELVVVHRAYASLEQGVDGDALAVGLRQAAAGAEREPEGGGRERRDEPHGSMVGTARGL